MLKSTFDTNKSLNDRLLNKIAQANQYDKFLKRIQSIVDRKPKVDRSSEFYMTFLNKSREKSNKQKYLERAYMVQLQNKNLLLRIQKQKKRKLPESQTISQIHWGEKRLRDHQKINQQNGKMAQRILKKGSYLVNKKIVSFKQGIKEFQKSKITKLRESELKFFDSRIKDRKLPKLINASINSNTESIKNSFSLHNPTAIR